MPSLQAIAVLLSQYGYFFLLPIAIIEGPIITIIGAFLASTGILNIYLVYVIAVIGDIVGDAISVVKWGNVESPYKYKKYGLLKGISMDINMMKDVFRTISFKESIVQITQLLRLKVS